MPDSSHFDWGVWLSFPVVLLLEVISFGQAGNVWRPDFVFLFCCFLALYHRGPFLLEMLCLIGLIADIVCGTTLGKHALSILVAVGVLSLFSTRIRHADVVLETLVVALLAFVHGLVLQSLNLLNRETVLFEWVLYPALATLLFWPLVRLILLSLRSSRHGQF
ncbi:MAG: rod shape-determining protein MreD [bacterium]